MRYAHLDMSSANVDRHASYNKSRIFLVSVLALVTAGMAASIRADIASELQRIFFDPIDKAHSAEMIGNVLGVPFLGFAITIALGSPLLDIIGMGLLLPLSAVCFILGTLTILFAGSFASGAGIYNVIWMGAVITGIGWLITVDKKRRIVKDAAIAVSKGMIAAIGKSADIAKSYDAASTVDARGAVATPGFTDCPSET